MLKAAAADHHTYVRTPVPWKYSTTFGSLLFIQYRYNSESRSQFVNNLCTTSFRANYFMNENFFTTKWYINYCTMCT